MRSWRSFERVILASVPIGARLQFVGISEKVNSCCYLTYSSEKLVLIRVSESLREAINVKPLQLMRGLIKLSLKKWHKKDVCKPVKFILGLESLGLPLIKKGSLVFLETFQRINQALTYIELIDRSSYSGKLCF